MADLEKIIDCLEKAKRVIDIWVPMFEQFNSPAGIDEAIAILKDQDKQKRKWLQTIADTQLAISPTGNESEDELAKRTGEWNGLQMAWEIIAGEERFEHPRLVRCKDCKYGEQMCQPWNDIVCTENNAIHIPVWYCADGKRR